MNLQDTLLIIVLIIVLIVSIHLSSRKDPP